MIATTGLATATLAREPQPSVSQRVLALSSRQPRRALALARRALARTTPPEDGTGSAAAIERGRLLRAYGHSLRAVGEYRGARAAYLKARGILAAAGAELEHAICALGLVDACMYLGRTSEALAAAAEARPVFERHRDRTRLAKLETNVGNLHHRLEALGPALEHYEHAARLFARRGSPLEIASVDCNRANILIHMGRRREAETLFESARLSFLAAGEPILAAHTRYGLAYLRFLSGEYARAIAELEEVRPVLMQLGARGLLALADLDLAEVLGAMRLHAEALALGRSAARWFRAHGLPAERARCDLIVGNALAHLGDPRAAQRALIAAQRTLHAQGHAPGEAMVELTRGRLAMLESHAGHAARHALRAREMFTRAGFRTRALSATAVAAEALLSAGQHARARTLARRTMRQPRLPGDAYSRARLARIEGAANTRLGDAPAAIASYRVALAESARVNSALFVDEWRVGFVDGEPALLDEYLGVLLARRRDLKPEQVWQWLAGARASLGAASGGRRREMSAAVREKCSELQGELEACYARLTTGWAEQRGSAERFATQQLEERANRIETRLRRLAGSRSGATVAKSRPEAAVRLAEGEVLLAYFSADGRLGAVCLHDEQWSLARDLASMEDVDRELRLFHYQMNARGVWPAGSGARARWSVERADEHLARLSGLLLAPLRAVGPRPRRVRVLPYGPLFRVPFQALPWGAGRLQDACEVVLGTPPDADRIPMPSGRHGACVIAFGDPKRDTIEQEARGVAEVLERGGVDVSLHLGNAATRDVVVEAARQSAVLHLCGHGMFRPQHPEFSALRLADGWLSARDLATLPLAGVTAVLSGCETGPRAVAAGDEALGLIRGLARAGSAAVVSSLWRVDDQATRPLMIGLYRHWFATGRLGAGLRAVQLERALVDPDPYLWAPFGLSGDADAKWPVSVATPSDLSFPQHRTSA